MHSVSTVCYVVDSRKRVRYRLVNAFPLTSIIAFNSAVVLTTRKAE